jgi:hypothetical protein
MDLVAVNKLATAAASAPRSFFSMRWFGGNLCHYFRDKKGQIMLPTLAIEDAVFLLSQILHVMHFKVAVQIDI